MISISKFMKLPQVIPKPKETLIFRCYDKDHNLLGDIRPKPNDNVVDVNYDTNHITLIKGHGYPVPEISNGFDWKYDNTNPYEFDKDCLNWEFYDIPNGKMLNCYPENIFPTNIDLLKKIKNLVN